MRYPDNLRIIVDVTKPPYCADNTGKTDCTEALIRAYNDLILEDVAAFKKTFAQVKAAPDDQDTYIGFQTRKTRAGKFNVSYSENLPLAKIMYFPNGTYLVSDTIIYRTRESRKHHGGKFNFELNRNIHFEGESREGAIIRLQDHAKGFEYGQIRPIISFILRPETVAEHVANNAMLNSVKDLTIDCGVGNGGAVGIKYYANNTGMISNVTIRSSDPDHDGFAGLLMTGGCIGDIRDVEIDGFDYGVLITKGERELYERVLFKNQKICSCFAIQANAVFKDIQNQAVVPTFNCDAVSFVTASFIRVQGITQSVGQFVYCRDTDKTEFPVHRLSHSNEVKNTLGLPLEDVPRYTYPDVSKWVGVEDFGAVGDGLTDCTAAIQNAMNSGAEIVYFNQGQYLITDEIRVPQSVRMIDFCFCDLVAGQKLREGSTLGAFVIDEDGDQPLFMANAFTWEKFYGMFHFVRHSAKRDLVLRDVHLQTACVYRNTVGGSRVFLENVACTTGDFSEWYFYRREDRVPIYSENIPFEFHGQRVFARNINPERADLEILNDGGDLVILGVYCEGPGTVVKTVNGGRTEVMTFVAAAGADNPDKPIFVNENSDVSAVSGWIFGAPRVYPTVVREFQNGVTRDLTFEELHAKSPTIRFLSGYIGELK